jgi:lipoate-protein ligase A
LGLQALGLRAELADGAVDQEHRSTSKQLPTVCFAQASRCDMVAAGLKVVGSAQVRKRGIILQHGSIPLRLHLEDQIAVMPGPEGRPESADQLGQVARGIAELVERPLGFEELGEAMVQGFAEHFGVEFSAGELSAAEQEKAGQLRAEKYATETWNLTRPRRTRQAST